METLFRYHHNLFNLNKGEAIKGISNNMDTINKRVLTPNLLDVDPNSPTAEKQYVHWRKNFDYFLEDAQQSATAQ